MSMKVIGFVLFVILAVVGLTMVLVGLVSLVL